MTPERHQLVCDLLYQALELDAAERDSFLNRACRSDTSLLQEVGSLLASSEDVRANFLRSSANHLTLEPGTTLGDYEVESLLGSGGMGEVYRAKDLRLGRVVAIKVVTSYLAKDRKRLWRFEQEARAVASLDHPNILAVHQLGEYQGVPYLVSELLNGETLRERIKRGPIPALQAADIAIQIAGGLHAAHQKGIVHRDLKPENLFMTLDGRVKILDFGLAKLAESNLKGSLATEAGAVIGTLGYMSPEQARGQPADARSDIFALGAVMYEMLTGKLAFDRATAADKLSAVLNDDPPALAQRIPNVPVALQRIVQRCLEKQPDKRFQTASDLVPALEASVSGQTSRRPISALNVALLLLVVVIAGIATAQKEAILHAFRGIFHSPETISARSPLREKKLTANLAENPVTAAAISRDGKYVAFNDSSKKVQLLLVETGDVRSLALDSTYKPVDWFPDGVSLLVDPLYGQPGLWKFSTWDSSLHRIWEGPLGGVGSSGPIRNASVSPDGTRIAFVVGAAMHEIWVMGSGGEEPHKIVELFDESLGNVVWSPTGQRLAYVRVRGTFAKHESVIESCDLTGNNRATFLSEPTLWGRSAFGSMAWLADGRVVYALAPHGDEYNLWEIRITTDGLRPIGKPEPLTDWRDLAAPGFQSTADGKRIIVLKGFYEDAIYIGTLASGSGGFHPKRLVGDSWRNTVNGWTKDSRSVLFYSKRNGNWTIDRQAIDSSKPTSLISGPESYRDPVATVSGILLYNAFTSDAPVAERRLMSTPLEGGPRSVLMTRSSPYTFECASSASGRCVIAEVQGEQLAFSDLDPIKGKGNELARVEYHTGTMPLWSLSPDGARIAMVDASQESSEVKIFSLEDRRLTALRLKGWKWKFLTSVAWAADSRRLFAVTESESSSALISVTPAGELSVLLEIDPGRAWIGKPVASPDGQYLAITKDSYASDLVVLDNF